MNDRGELQQHLLADGTRLNETALDLLAHMCVANCAIATMQARGWEARSGNRGFYPVDGFTMIGMDWSAITNGNLGVVVGSRDADYALAYEMLAELGAAG
jgi:roadblock/LC7 domain-containing protein